MLNEFSRSELILGQEAMEKLANSKVAIFGIGGVGSYVAEALARVGVGHLSLFDNDVVSLTNINRQIIANHDTIGQAKVEIMKERIGLINPNAVVIANTCYYDKNNESEFPLGEYDYIVDAIDSVTSKILLVMNALQAQVPMISSMGTGNKIHPEMLEIDDIYKTSVCPLAKVMRKELKVRGVKKLSVLYSKEQPIKPLSPSSITDDPTCGQRRGVPGSVSFVPSVGGLIIAGEVVRQICNLS